MKKIFTATAILLFILQSLTARDGANIILVVDKSGSMKGYFDEVKAYLADSILPLTEPDDFFCLILFGEDADCYFTDEIDRDHLDSVRAVIDDSRADQDFTDIGLALEAMFSTLEQSQKLNDKSILLFITDGKNTPPPWSKYYGKDYEYQEVFFEKARTIKEGAWKVMILGIGEDTAAKDLSEILDGEYIEVSSNLSADLLAASIGDFLGHMEMFIEPDLGRIRPRGRSVSYKIDSTYKSSRQIVLQSFTVKELYRKTDSGWIPVSVENATIDIDQEFTVLTDQPASGSFGFAMPKYLDKGEYKAVLAVTTGGDRGLLYDTFEVSFVRVASPFIYVAIGLIFLLLLLALYFFVLRRRWQ